MKDRQNKILVPIDGSPASLKAVEVGAKFAAVHNSELILLYVVEPVSGLVEFFTDTELEEKRRDWGIRLLQNIRKSVDEPGVQVSEMIATGRPYRKILEVSEEIMAEMIVMGSRGTHTENEQVAGSNTHRVYRNSKVPVVSVPSNIENTEFAKVLLPVDPNFGVVELERFLYEYRKSYKPVVEMITVVNNETELEEARAFLDKNKSALVRAGILDVLTNIVIGSDPAYAIMQYAEDNGHDIIWMETHGRKGLSGWILGSVTGEVIDGAGVPVLSLFPEREPSRTYYYHTNLPI